MHAPLYSTPGADTMDSFGATLLILLALIACNGWLAMSEMAMVAARRARLRQRADRRQYGARAALELSGAPGRFLATVQLGITLVGVLAGAIGEATIARALESALAGVPSLAPYRRGISLAVVVLGITYVSLVFGELVPKRVGLARAEQVASLTAPLMRALSRLAAPVVRTLTASTDAVLALWRLRAPAESPVTEEDIRLLIAEGTHVGAVEPLERDLLERVFRLGDHRVTALMTPRTEVVCLDVDDPADTVRRTLTDSGHARFPLVQGSLDRVLGMVQAKDVLTQLLAEGTPHLRSVLQPALFVPEGMTGLALLQRFKDTRSPFAFVIDEFGGFEGVVTVNDVLEAIVGDVPLEDRELEPAIVERADGSWLVDGRLRLDELKQLLGLAQLPGEDRAEYETLGGLVMTVLGRIPRSGDAVGLPGFRLEVMDMDGRRVDKVLIARQPPGDG